MSEDLKELLRKALKESGLHEGQRFKTCLSYKASYPGPYTGANLLRLIDDFKFAVTECMEQGEEPRRDHAVDFLGLLVANELQLAEKRSFVAPLLDRMIRGLDSIEKVEQLKSAVTSQELFDKTLEEMGAKLSAANVLPDGMDGPGVLKLLKQAAEAAGKMKRDRQHKEGADAPEAPPEPDKEPVAAGAAVPEDRDQT